MIKDHYLAFRRHPFFAESTILYIIENKTGMEHHWYKYLLSTLGIFDNVFVLKELDGQMGFNTTHNGKILEAYGLRGTIDLDGLAICKEIISANPDMTRCGDAAAEMLLNQISEMREYNFISLGGEKLSITSIHTADGKRIAGRKDDLCQALKKGLDIQKKYLQNRLPPDQYPKITEIRENRRTVNHINKRMRFTAEIDY